MPESVIASRRLPRKAALAWALAALFAAPAACFAAEAPPILRTVTQVRGLSVQEAARGLPVQVTGTLTYFDPSDWKHFLQDEGVGIYFSLPESARDPRMIPGSRVEIEGVTGPGEYAPIVVASQVVYLDDVGVPAPRSTSVSAVVNGSEDSQWIALRAVVQSQAVVNGRTVLALWTPEAVLNAKVPSLGLAGDLVDATVEVGAVAGTIFNERLQFRGVELLIPDASHVRVLEAAPAEPHALPVQRIGSLLRYHAGVAGFHRFRFEGVATLSRPDGTIVVQDETGGMIVQLRDPEAVHVPPGTVVSVVGFPTAKDKRALRNALVAPAGPTRLVEPRVLEAGSQHDEGLHASVVALAGRVVGQATGGREDVLTVEFGDGLVDAVLEKSLWSGELPRIAAGSRVGLTGVYLAQFDEARNVRSFRLLLRSPGDAVVLARPAWWTLQTTLWALAGLATALVGVLLWGGLLRREVRRRTHELSREVEERKRAEARLAKETALLQAEVEERRQAEKRLKETHEQLLVLSRRAGMAEVATSVLHNVGNVLNSVNVSATLVADTARRSKVANIARLSELLEGHRDHLAAFLSDDPKGRMVQPYLSTLAKDLEAERAAMLGELAHLRKNIDHIKDVVAMQQSYARTSGLVEDHVVTDLVDDALRLNAESLARHEVSVVRRYEGRPVASLDKHKVLQILVNLIRNAKHACDESGRTDKTIEVRVAAVGEHVEIAVTDNGVGVPPENLTRIFSYGFTTRAHGHGFGLHSGALAATEMGGTLSVHSEGPGCGATFLLSLPLQSKGPPA